MDDESQCNMYECERAFREGFWIGVFVMAILVCVVIFFAS